MTDFETSIREKVAAAVAQARAGGEAPQADSATKEARKADKRESYSRIPLAAENDKVFDEKGVVNVADLRLCLMRENFDLDRDNVRLTIKRVKKSGDDDGRYSKNDFRKILGLLLEIRATFLAVAAAAADKPLNHEDFGVAFRAMHPGASKKLVGRFIKAFDEDDSGTIDLDEFVNIALYYKELLSQFKRRDKDNSGTLDARELDSVVRALDLRYTGKELLRKYDEKDTGSIDFETYATIVFRYGRKTRKEHRDRAREKRSGETSEQRRQRKEDELRKRAEKYDKREEELTRREKKARDRRDRDKDTMSKSGGSGGGGGGGSKGGKEEKVRPATLEEGYEIQQVLGEGAYGVVKKGVERATGDEVAVKFIEYSNAKDDMVYIRREIEIMKTLRHPNIVKLYDVFETDTQIALVMELVSGGELFDYIVEKGSLTEAETATFSRQMLSAIQCMHEIGIVHRDLKPENLLMGGANKDQLKITDFGLSNVFDIEDGSAALATMCGTPNYIAPEIVMGEKYSQSVDIWATGVITYIMLCGYPPFYGEQQRMLECIMEARYDFPASEWDKISTEARDFVCALLKKEASARPSAEAAQELAWLKTSSKSEKAKLTRISTQRHAKNIDVIKGKRT